MAGRRGVRAGVDIWPGWVDALSSLVMVIVFLLMVFVLSQFYLSNALQGRDRQLAQLNARISELADLLAMERGGAEALRADVARLTEQLRASLAAREDLQARLDAVGQERDALSARIAALGDEAGRRQAELQAQLTEEQRLSAEARREVELLNQQLAALREQLAQLAATLDASEQKAREQEAQIADLGRRLNAALAGKVAELIRYRSEFFGRLREVLGDRPDIRIVGDRFVFQSEVLFESGSADLGDAGKSQLASLATTLKEVSARFPADLNWILRVDGHTDVVPMKSARFPSNWELSTARATSVVQFLISQGIAPERLAATGFGEFQPLEQGSAADVLARNRRIEIKLDQR
ncbi:MAG TPA: peptidoglycan -binding protein [Azospirillaceae bacterium]|nr:peptidoglycan -binding protein [Azospirillaceae bacterium]